MIASALASLLNLSTSTHSLSVFFFFFVPLSFPSIPSYLSGHKILEISRACSWTSIVLFPRGPESLLAVNTIFMLICPKFYL